MFIKVNFLITISIINPTILNTRLIIVVLVTISCLSMAPRVGHPNNIAGKDKIRHGMSSLKTGMAALYSLPPSIFIPSGVPQ